MTAAVRTATGTYLVDLAEEELIGEAEPFEPARIDVTLPRVVATAASGSTVVAVVDRGNYPVASFDGVDSWPSLIAANPAGELRYGPDAAAVRHDAACHRDSRSRSTTTIRT